MKNQDLFFRYVRESVFGGHMTHGQADGLTQILDYREKNFSSLSSAQLAYCLATMTWETARTMQPIEEIGRGRGRSYGHPTGPWHKIYDGRGDVQLTWYDNYVYADRRLHELGLLRSEENLAKNPALAMRSDVAAAIMLAGMTEGWFTKKKLSDYVHDDVADYVHARRIINGNDRAQQISAIAVSYRHALQEAS